MYVKKPKKQCPHNAWVECDDEDCQCCSWNPAGRTKKKERKHNYPKERKKASPEGEKYLPQEKKEADRKIQTNNISGHTGVYWNIQRGKWIAEIQRNGVKNYLGGFDSVDDAVKARKEAEKRLLQPKKA